MHFLKLFLAAATALSVRVAANRDNRIDIQFHRYSDDDCREEISDSQLLYSNDCKNYELGFGSYKFHKDGWFKLIHVANDWNDPTCQVVVFDELWCHGQGYSMGAFRDHIEECGQPKGRSGNVGYSVYVACGDKPAVPGIVGGGGAATNGQNNGTCDD